MNRQLEAYNAHDVSAFTALFSDNAVLQDLASGDVTVRGQEAIGAFYAARFLDNPELRCHVHNRMDLGAFAIDRETVTGLSTGSVEIIAIYEVRNGLIQSVKFVR